MGYSGHRHTGGSVGRRIHVNRELSITHIIRAAARGANRVDARGRSSGAVSDFEGNVRRTRATSRHEEVFRVGRSTVGEIYRVGVGRHPLDRCHRAIRGFSLNRYRSFASINVTTALTVTALALQHDINGVGLGWNLTRF